LPMKRAEWLARRGAIALALILGYLAIDNHVPLDPWNDLAAAGPQWQSTLARWLPGLFTVAAIFTVRAALRMRARNAAARMASPRYFHFAPSRFSYAERRDRIREIINNERVLERLPPTFEVAVRIEAPIAEGATLSEAHSTWNDAGSVETPSGLPRQPPNAQCPHGLVRVAVECVKRRSGGMGSYYGFEGYFVSLLVLIEAGKIWDARGDDAS